MAKNVMAAEKMVVYVGADHAGFPLKELLTPFLVARGYVVKDLGALALDPGDDYPDFASRVAEAVRRTGGRGVLFCGSAEGMCMAANKYPGIRAALAASRGAAVLTREHNDANILCLSGWNMPLARAKATLQAFLETPFSGEERHRRRLGKIAAIERKVKKLPVVPKTARGKKKS